MYIRSQRFRRPLRAVAAVSLSLALLLPFTLPTNADDLASLRSQYAALQKQKQQLNSELYSQQSKYNTAAAQKANIDKSISLTNQQISLLDAQIASLNTQMQETTQEIAQTQKQVDANYALFKQRVSAMYVSGGNQSFLDVLLESTSPTDFLMRVEILQTVSRHDTSLIAGLKQDVQKLQTEQASLQQSQQSLSESQGAIAAQRDILRTQQAQQSQIVAQLSSGVGSAKQKVNSVGQQMSATSNQMDELLAEERAQQSSTGGTVHADSNFIVSYARTFLGRKYVFGADGKTSAAFDCSGFTAYVFGSPNVKIYLPHDAAGQSGYGTAVSRNNLQPGDLVFFATEGGSRITHVGIYEGNGTFIAANSGSAMCVSEQGIWSSYWGPKFVCARRLIG